MRLYKFCLFSSKDFELFKGPVFLGPHYSIMVAVPYEATKKEISESEYSVSFLTHSASSSLAEAHECSHLAAELADKLKDAEVKAIFDLRETHCEWHYKNMRCLRLLDKEIPLEIEKAKKVAEKILLLKNEERKLLGPTIPWKTMDPKEHTESLRSKTLRSFYDLQHPEIASIVHEHDRKKKLLLHVCCGPDAAGVVEQLKDEFELTCFWYDPNIQPKEEYDLRLDAFLKVTSHFKIPTIVGEYDADRFLSKIKGLEASPEQGAKCTLCYDMRLERTADEAIKLKSDLFSTTLAISPHKVQEKLKLLGKKLAEQKGVGYLARNFMKHDGFKDSVRFTEEHNIYRQDYCGCWFSLHEGGNEAKAKAKKLGLTQDNLLKGTYSIPHE